MWLFRACAYFQAVGFFFLASYLAYGYFNTHAIFTVLGLILLASVVVGASYYMVYFFLMRGSRYVRSLFFVMASLSSLALIYNGFFEGQIWLALDNAYNACATLYNIILLLLHQLSAMMLYNPDADQYFNQSKAVLKKNRFSQ